MKYSLRFLTNGNSQIEKRGGVLMQREVESHLRKYLLFEKAREEIYRRKAKSNVQTKSGDIGKQKFRNSRALGWLIKKSF